MINRSTVKEEFKQMARRGSANEGILSRLEKSINAGVSYAGEKAFQALTSKVGGDLMSKVSGGLSGLVDPYNMGSRYKPLKTADTSY